MIRWNNFITNIEQMVHVKKKEIIPEHKKIVPKIILNRKNVLKIENIPRTKQNV